MQTSEVLTGSEEEGRQSMKSLKSLLFGLVVFTCIGAHAQVPGPKSSDKVEAIKAEILKVEDERNAAIMRGDTATLDKMYSDEIAWTNPSGELLTKAEVLAHLKSGEQKFFSIKHSDRQLHVYGDNVVVMTVFTRSTVRYKGKTSDAPRRFTNVFVKQNGQWMLVVHHATPVLAQ
jgi:ketosteroid isomerase-like protein